MCVERGRGGGRGAGISGDSPHRTDIDICDHFNWRIEFKKV